MARGMISNTFEAMLQEKVHEINQLKSELEKYKMGEKLATSILESPYCYSSNAQQIINNRKKSGPMSLINSNAQQLGNSQVLNGLNFEGTGYGENILDQSYNSNNSNISIPAALNITYGS